MADGFDGDKYARASAHQKEWGARLAAELDLEGGERILDLGCGDGYLTARLADLVPGGRVLGIDSSRSMLEAAARHRRANLAFALMDIRAIGFAGEFDVIYSNATLHWVLDHGALLPRVAAALSDGGRARFSFGGDGNSANLLRAVRETMRRREMAPFFENFRWPWYMPAAAEYRALVNRSHFARTEVWIENADRLFPDAQSITAWIDQPCLAPFVTHLAAGDPCGSAAGDFRDAVVEHVLAATRRAGGGHFETFRRMNLLAAR